MLAALLVLAAMAVVLYSGLQLAEQGILRRWRGR
jgi:ABC-type nitrate/sulfonate/bicarbonate transport system permease component